MAFIALAGCSAGAVAYAFLFNTDRRREERRKAARDRSRRPRPTASVVKASRDRRRRSRQAPQIGPGLLKELEQKQQVKNVNIKKPPLKMQLRQAGMQVSIERSSTSIPSRAASCCHCHGICPRAPLLIVVPGAAACRRARLAALVRLASGASAASRRSSTNFPNALDIIVRAVKSGLPLNDGIRLIANEVARAGQDRVPPRSSNRSRSACRFPTPAMRMTETMPCPEAGFFGIVIQIQQQAGGNLSEALGNLSRVLRDRKKMKAKVQALSMEAKASAVIIGALPFIVAFLVYLTSPNYIMPLFDTSTGHLILGVCGHLDVDRHLRDAQDDEFRRVAGRRA